MIGGTKSLGGGYWALRGNLRFKTSSGYSELTGFLLKVGLSDHASPGQSDIEGDHRGWGFWLNQLSKILTNIGQYREEHGSPEVED